MITVIDRITYLPKDKPGTLLPVNAIRNEAAKEVFNQIKSKLQRIQTSGKSATAEVVGRIPVNSNFSLHLNVKNCDDPELKEKILAVLSK